MLQNKRYLNFVLCLGGIALPVIHGNPLAANGQSSDAVDFVTTIKPILEQHCLKCHGEKDPKNFRIDIKDEAMGYIAENSADDSDLYQVLVTDDEEMLMPPPDAKNPLAEEQIQSIKTWINQGAEWPDDAVFVSAPAPEATNQAADDSENTADSGADEVLPAPVVNPDTQRLLNAVGSLHPAAIHLPIGLLLGAGLFALFSLRGNFVMSDCAYYCLWLGTVGAVIACLTGWWASPMANKGTVLVIDDLWNMKQPVFWHRTSAFAVTAFAFLLGLFAASARSRDPDDGMIWKLGCILLAAGIGFVGHEGGELTHGKHHYDAINSIGAEMFPGLYGVKPEEQKQDPPTPGDAANTAEESPSADGDQDADLGKTSDET